MTNTIRRDGPRFLAAVMVSATAIGLAASPQSPPASPQAAATSRLAFDVAAVRQNNTKEAKRNWDAVPGGFTATNVPLRELIRIAYGVNTLVLPRQQIVGAPDWINTDRFDIVAKVDAPPDADAKKAREKTFAMLQTLLGERFHIQSRMETREMAVYDLVRVGKKDALGPQLTPATGKCASEGAAADENNEKADPAQRCGLSSTGRGKLVGRGIKLSDLVIFLQLSPAVGRIVHDQTGLTGPYDFHLEYAPPMQLGPNRESDAAAAEEAARPSLPTALQDQLGLKLEPTKGPIDVLVIEHIERLAEDK